MSGAMSEVQAEALELVKKHGGIRAASRATGIAFTTLQNRYQKALDWIEADPAISRAAMVIGSDTVPSVVWTKTDKNGNVSYSVLSKSGSNQKSIEDIAEVIRDAISTVPKAPPVAKPQYDTERAAIFPVADLHIGLLTDEEEVGEDWDTKKALSVFTDNFSRLVDMTPSGSQAVLAQLGDLSHVDDSRNETPASKHKLDADSRYFQILRRSVEVIKCGIEILRRKYPLVIYRGCRGNHDPHAHYGVTMALAIYYRDIEGVEIIESASEFYKHEYGKNMLVLCHGDKTTPQRMATFVAAEWPEAWGRTRFRTVLTGHYHSAKAVDVGGIRYETFGTIIPRDSYAYSHAYASQRQLVSITLDPELGEVGRNSLPIMGAS